MTRDGAFESSKKFFSAKKYQTGHDHRKAEHDDHRVPHRPPELRHTGEVHSIPSNNEGQWREQRGDDSEHLHDPVLLDVHLCLVDLAHLHGVFPQSLGVTAQPGGPLGKQLEQLQAFGFKDRGLIFLELLADADELFVIAVQIQQLTPKQGELAVKIGKGIVQNVFLQQSNTAFKALEYGEVISNQVVATITRSGNGTAVFTIILAILLLITSEMEIIERSFWNILLNPFKVPDNFLPVIWEGLIVKNRIFLLIGGIVWMMIGLLNLQKRERFI